MSFYHCGGGVGVLVVAVESCVGVASFYVMWRVQVLIPILNTKAIGRQRGTLGLFFLLGAGSFMNMVTRLQPSIRIDSCDRSSANDSYRRCGAHRLVASHSILPAELFLARPSLRSMVRHPVAQQ